MRKEIVILIIGLFCCVALMAQTSSFYSTSAYVNNYQSPISNHQSPKVTGSFSSISAANYASLNSEGGACYRASSGPRKGRGKMDDYGGTGTIGDYTSHSPIGEIPFGIMLLFVLAYVGYKKRNSLQEKKLTSGTPRRGSTYVNGPM